MKSSSHCYGSHLNLALGAKTTAPSFILLFSPSVPEGRWICNLHWLCKAVPDKMNTKRNPSSISNPIVQIWGKKVSEHSGGIRSPSSAPCACPCALGIVFLLAGSVLQDALRCPVHDSHGGSFKLLFPSPSSPSLVLLLHIRRQRAKC